MYHRSGSKHIIYSSFRPIPTFYCFLILILLELELSSAFFKSQLSIHFGLVMTSCDCSFRTS